MGGDAKRTVALVSLVFHPGFMDPSSGIISAAVLEGARFWRLLHPSA